MSLTPRVRLFCHCWGGGKRVSRRLLSLMRETVAIPKKEARSSRTKLALIQPETDDTMDSLVRAGPVIETSVSRLVFRASKILLKRDDVDTIESSFRCKLLILER